jgi:replicative DNA helicase
MKRGAPLVTAAPGDRTEQESHPMKTSLAIPPDGASVEAEQAVLGALLTEDDAWEQCRDLLSPDLFVANHPVHAALAETLLRMLRDGQKVDPILLQTQLQAEGKLGTSVPVELPLALARAVGSAANIRFYAQRLVELRDVRLGGDEGAILDRAAPPVGRFAKGALQEMERRATGEIGPVVMPWPALNERLGGGLWPGLHVLTGTTGSGKTQLALQIACSAARRFATERAGDERGTGGAPVLYVALELSKTELVARVLALLTSELEGRGGRGVMWSDLYLGRNREGLRKAAEKCGPVLETLPLRIEEAPAGAWTASRLSGRAAAMRAMYRRTPLVVLDYLQIVGPENDRQDLRACIRSAALAARNVAREGAAVLLLSSVSRENAKLLGPGDEGIRPEHAAPGKGGSDPASLVGLGKESGEIEFSADSVLALVRETFRQGGTPMHLAAAKVRAGKPGWVSLSFDGTIFSPAKTTAPSPVQDEFIEA